MGRLEPATRPARRVPRPLAGVTVVSFEQAVSAPFATRQLADLGARVIKVERPEGDFARGYDESVGGLSSYFAWLNRNKESLCLDLKAPGATVVLERLLETADVVVQNLSPGAAARLGLEARQLHRRHSNVIVCTITGYGPGGPLSDRKAYDLLMQFETGLVSINGSSAEPAKVAISIADIAAGMYAFSGVLAALFVRQRTGIARAVDVSMLDALGEWMSQPALVAQFGQHVGRHGQFHASIAPYGPYATSDGGATVIAVQNEREWQRFCSVVLGDPNIAADELFSTNSRRTRNRRDLDRLISAKLASLDRAELTERLNRAQIANCAVNGLSGFLEHPQLRARKRWGTVDSEFGPFSALLPPLWGEECRMGSVPSLGQHTAEILAELGVELSEGVVPPMPGEAR